MFKHSASELSMPFISLSTAQDREAQLSTGRKSCPQPKSNSGKEISLTACLSRHLQSSGLGVSSRVCNTAGILGVDAPRVAPLPPYSASQESVSSIGINFPS